MIVPYGTGLFEAAFASISNLQVATEAAANLHASRKPWSDRDVAPWGNGDVDGEPVTPMPYRDAPGDEIRETPASSPSNDLDE